MESEEIQDRSPGHVTFTLLEALQTVNPSQDQPNGGRIGELEPLWVDMDGADQSVCGAQAGSSWSRFLPMRLARAAPSTIRRSFERPLQCAENASADGY